MWVRTSRCRDRWFSFRRRWSQPLSLIIHELVVNALTHGSLSRPDEGSLLITWNAGAGIDEDLHFNWDERGGKPAAPRAGGFGTVILGALIEKQLSGSISRNWRDDGETVGLDVLRR
jgi:two-component sensor histidine kinase